MKLHTHLMPDTCLELQELTPRHFHQLPWVDPVDLPLDSVLQVYRWDWELGVVYIGDFGYYKCLPDPKFMTVIELMYRRAEELLTVPPSSILLH